MSGFVFIDINIYLLTNRSIAEPAAVTIITIILLAPVLEGYFVPDCHC